HPPHGFCLGYPSRHLHRRPFTIRFCLPSLIALEEIPMRALSSLRPARNLHAPSTVAGTLLLVTGVGASAACAAEHTLMPSPKTVHIGYFLATVKPVLSIDSGGIVNIESPASWVPSRVHTT